MAIRQRNIKDGLRLVGVYASASAFLAAIDETAAEGMTYYDTTDNVLKCYDGSSWRAQGATVAAVGLPAAIALDPKATAPFEVEISGSTANLVVLDANGTTNVDILDISSAGGSGDLINLTQGGTGKDIMGTSGTWSVTKAGVGAFAAVSLADAKPINIGTSSDITIQWDGTDLLIDGAAADTIIKIGATNNQDVIIYGDTVTDLVTFDTSAELCSFNGFDLLLMDSDYLKLGDASDITITWDGTSCKVAQATANSLIEVGVDGAGIDFKLFGDTSGDYLLFDQSADRVILEDIDMTFMDGTTLCFGDGASNAGDFAIYSDGTSLLVTEVSAAGKAITFGVDNKGMDVKMYGETASSYLLWDQSADTLVLNAAGLTVTSGNTSMTGTLTVGVDDTGHDVKFFGATASSYCLWDESADTLILAASNLSMTGTITVGVDDTGHDVKFYGATASAYMLWDESADDLILAGAAGLSVAGATTLTGAVSAGSTVTATTGVQSAAVARTATADGTTTGTIADGTSVVAVTCDSADKIIVLPTPTPGNIVWLLPNATGYELRSDTPASVAINGGTGAAAESAIGADTLVRCVCTSATTWVASAFSTAGAESAVEVAA